MAIRLVSLYLLMHFYPFCAERDMYMIILHHIDISSEMSVALLAISLCVPYVVK